MDADIDSIAKALSSHVIRFGTELQMQDDVEQILLSIGIAPNREHQLSNGIVDFFTDGTAIECKVDRGLAEVMRQCRGYLNDRSVTGLILVTSRHTHRTMPSTLAGKPIRTVWVARVNL